VEIKEISKIIIGVTDSLLLFIPLYPVMAQFLEIWNINFETVAFQTYIFGAFFCIHSANWMECFCHLISMFTGSGGREQWHPKVYGSR
jgi:hypothetical protein